MNHRKIRLHHLRYHRNSIALFIGSKCHGWCNIAVLRDGTGLFFWPRVGFRVLRSSSDHGLRGLPVYVLVTNYVAFLQSVPMMLMDSRPTQSANLQRPGPSRPSLVHLRNGIPSSSSQLLDNEATVSFTIYLHNSYVYCVKVLGQIHLALIDGLFCFSFEFSETWWSFNTHWSLRLHKFSLNSNEKQKSLCNDISKGQSVH